MKYMEQRLAFDGEGHSPHGECGLKSCPLKRSSKTLPVTPRMGSAG